jgi:ribosomal protein S18 acetylase RimI-like enzyme
MKNTPETLKTTQQPKLLPYWATKQMCGVYLRDRHNYGETIWENEADYIDDKSMDICLDVDEEMQVIGKIKFSTVDIRSAENKGLDAFSICDNDSQGVVDAYKALFEPELTPQESVARIIGETESDVIGTNFMYIYWMELLPQFRGYGYGKKAICIAMEKFGKGMDLTAIRPHATQHNTTDAEYLAAMYSREGFSKKDAMSKALACLEVSLQETLKEYKHLELDKFKTNAKESKEKLSVYFSEIGFEKCSDDLMAMPTMAWNCSFEFFDDSKDAAPVTYKRAKIKAK